LPALTESKVVEPSGRTSYRGLGGDGMYQLAAFAWTQAAPMVLQVAGLALATAGFLMGAGVLWTQLARALPLVGLIHHARTVRALVLVAGGIGLLLLGRRR